VHPRLVAAFIDDSVAGLRERLGGTDLPIVSVDLDLDVPELRVVFDHHERETVVADALTGLLSADGQHYAQKQRVPLLGGARRSRRLQLRMNVEQFDFKAPTAELLDEHGNPLAPDAWPQSWLGRGIVEQHPAYSRPFFCRPGLREYHEHHQHEDEPWAKWREVLPLQMIVVGLLGDMRERFFGAA
jgi:hypothetical protein